MMNITWSVSRNRIAALLAAITSPRTQCASRPDRLVDIVVEVDHAESTDHYAQFPRYVTPDSTTRTCIAREEDSA